MGFSCNIKELKSLWNLYSHYPVISITEKYEAIDRFKNYTHIHLGAILSSALLKYEKEDRKNHVLKELENLFQDLDSKKVIIDDIDILFNPEYCIDILGYFSQLGRNRRLVVIWPGEYYSESLTYASPEYKDYKRYLIKDYDVICLI